MTPEGERWAAAFAKALQFHPQPSEASVNAVFQGEDDVRAGRIPSLDATLELFLSSIQAGRAASRLCDGSPKPEAPISILRVHLETTVFLPWVAMEKQHGTELGSQPLIQRAIALVKLATSLLVPETGSLLWEDNKGWVRTVLKPYTANLLGDISQSPVVMQQYREAVQQLHQTGHWGLERTVARAEFSEEEMTAPTTKDRTLMGDLSACMWSALDVILQDTVLPRLPLSREATLPRPPSTPALDSAPPPPPARSPLESVPFMAAQLEWFEGLHYDEDRWRSRRDWETTYKKPKEIDSQSFVAAIHCLFNPVTLKVATSLFVPAADNFDLPGVQILKGIRPLRLPPSACLNIKRFLAKVMRFHIEGEIDNLSSYYVSNKVETLNSWFEEPTVTGKRLNQQQRPLCLSVVNPCGRATYADGIRVKPSKRKANDRGYLWDCRFEFFIKVLPLQAFHVWLAECPQLTQAWSALLKYREQDLPRRNATTKLCLKNKQGQSRTLAVLFAVMRNCVSVDRVLLHTLLVKGRLRRHRTGENSDQDQDQFQGLLVHDVFTVVMAFLYGHVGDAQDFRKKRNFQKRE